MMNSLINWVYGLITLFVLGFAVFAEEITTGNLLPNGTNNASNYQSVDSTIPNVTTNGFNTSGNIQNWGQEIEVTGTGGINVTGSLVNITTGEDTTTQDKLNNGVTLNSTTIVQNCEYQGSNWQCGQAKPGQDTYTTTVSILDENGNVLSTVNQVRNNDAGYGSNAYKYSDTVTYTGTGSNQFYWAWEGVDLGYDTYNTNLGGPNLLGAKLTMTYDNVVIQPEVIEEIEEIIEEFIEWEELFEEPMFETVHLAPLPLLEEFEIIELEEFLLEEPQVVEIIEEAFEELEEEFEEIEILQVFGGPEIVEEPEEEVTSIPEEEVAAIEEEVMEENTPTLEVAAKEEIGNGEDDNLSKGEVSSAPLETESGDEEELSTEEATTTAELEEPKEETKTDTAVVAEKSVEVETEVESQEFSIDVSDVEAKVVATVASVSKQLQIVSVVAARALTKNQADLSSYTNQNANLFDTRQLYQGNNYADTRTLDEYAVDVYTEQNAKFVAMSGNDPVLEYQRKVENARLKRIQLETELYHMRREHAR